MARVMELFVIVNALAGIATFLGLRFVWRRSRDATKRGFDVIHDKNEEEIEPWDKPSEIESTTSAGDKQSLPSPPSSLSQR